MSAHSHCHERIWAQDPMFSHTGQRIVGVEHDWETRTECHHQRERNSLFKVAEMSCTLMCIHTSHFNLIVLCFRTGVCFVCAGGEIQAGSYAVQTHCVLVGARVQHAAGGWRESQSAAIGCLSQPSYVLPKAAWGKHCPWKLWQGRKQTTFLMLMRGHIDKLQKWLHKVH